MVKFPKLIWLLLPALVFLLMMAIFITRLPKKDAVSTENNVVAVPTAGPTQSTQPVSPLQNLADQIQNFSVDDPTLARPTFDREIELPQ